MPAQSASSGSVLASIQPTGGTLGSCHSKPGGIFRDSAPLADPFAGADSKGVAGIVADPVPFVWAPFGYATAVRSLSQGRANFTMQFEDYETVPKQLADQIVARVRGY